jgi:hypothetical protein
MNGSDQTAQKRHTHVGVSRRKISVFTALVSALVILFLEIGYPNPNPNNNNHETEIRNKNPMNHMKDYGTDRV